MLKLVRRFQSEVDHKKILEQLQETTRRIKHKQTPAELSRVQAFVKQNVHKGRMGNLINKTARLDSKFDSFMNQVQNEEKIPNLIDYSKKPTKTVYDGSEYIASKLTNKRRSEESHCRFSCKDKT